MAIEQAAYTILLKEGSFEIRQTEAMIIAITDESHLDGSRGFSEIFNYISGYNQGSKKIAMTTPVINELQEKSMTTAFVMPKQYALSDLPLPKSNSLNLKEVPSKLVAVFTFSGSINRDKLQVKQAALLNWLKEKNLVPLGYIQLARYNPPFIPGFLKRNEVSIEIQRLP
ncbi:MAG: heme-binding protein [Erysipelotrichaceae bacterium]